MNWVFWKNRLTLDLAGGLAVLEDGSLPGDVEETAMVESEDGDVLGELTQYLHSGSGGRHFGWL